MIENEGNQKEKEREEKLIEEQVDEKKGEKKEEEEEEEEEEEVFDRGSSPRYSDPDDSRASSSSSSLSSHSSFEFQLDTDELPCNDCELCSESPRLSSGGLPSTERRTYDMTEDPGAALAAPLPNPTQAYNFARTLLKEAALVEDKERLISGKIRAMPPFSKDFMWFNNHATNPDHICKPIIVGLPPAAILSEKYEEMDIRNGKPADVVRERRKKWQETEPADRSIHETIAQR